MEGLLVVVVALILVCIAVMVMMAVMFAVAMALAIGVPAYLLIKNWPGISRHVNRLTQNPMERLQTLYVEGKIDLFEFERRVAHLIAVER